ncbi:MAG: DUF465 domain-containing protein [Paracoccaceae bacterium]|nr:hypothetical protein RB2150_07523 [Rhodobacterales bacterium HTCC2150] [Rhodobacteraceae bacterium HTCC2150]MDG1532329.1 DUF465 domain-containing protein [Paracoccaceae bacterium]
MAAMAHVQELKKKHEALSERVEVAQRHPGSDALSISEMKKQKLQIKQEIQKFSA